MVRRSFAEAAAASVSVKKAPMVTTTMPPPPSPSRPAAPRHDRLIIMSASQQQSLAAATAQFAQARLLEATPPDHRAAVDGTLGTYLIAQLQQQQQLLLHPNHRRPPQQNHDDNKINNDNNDDRWEALVELIHDHCHVEWPVAQSIIEAIVERLQTVAAPAPVVTAAAVDDDRRTLFPTTNGWRDHHEANGDGRDKGVGGGGGPSPRFAAPQPDSDLHFPPLGADVPQRTSHPTKPARGNASAAATATAAARSNPTSDRSAEADRVAAALFPSTTSRPRSRQNSSDETTLPPPRPSSGTEETSLQHTSLSPAYGGYPYPPPAAAQFDAYYNHQQQQLQQQQQQQQQQQDYIIYSTCELVLSMNAEVSYEAAYTASSLARADVNLAQYLVECTKTDTPICRDFLLHNACYRADCPYVYPLQRCIVVGDDDDACAARRLVFSFCFSPQTILLCVVRRWLVAPSLLFRAGLLTTRPNTTPVSFGSRRFVAREPVVDFCTISIRAWSSLCRN
jgi:hypothetical protein